MQRKRYFKIHTKTLISVAAKGLELTKYYTTFCNLHSLYEQKVIKNYKSKTHLLKEKCGLTDYEFRKHFNWLKNNGFIWINDWEYKDLRISSIKKWVSFLKLDEDFYDLKYKIHNTFHIKNYSEKNITYREIQSIALGNRLKQKLYAISLEISDKKGTSKNIERQLLFENFLTSSDLSSVSLYLNDIAKYLGLKSIQGASYTIHKMEKDGLIDIVPQFKYINKINSKDMQLERGLFIKDGWIIEQLPNHIVFKSTFFKNSKLTLSVVNHFNYKKKKISDKRNSKLRVIDNNTKKVIEKFINKKTGSIEHESIYFLNSDNNTKTYITPFKELYMKDIKTTRKIFDITYEDKVLIKKAS